MRHEAIDTVKSEHPEAFDGDYVKNVGLCVVEVIKAFDRMGICADFDGEEIAVKKTNDFSEQYDVNYADKYVRTGSGIFRGSCYPAAF